MRFIPKYSITISVLVFTLLLPATVTHGSDLVAKRERLESAAKKTEREQRFLYRAVEDTNKSWEYVNDTSHELETQIDAIQLLEPVRREKDLRLILEWYRTYEDWLAENARGFEDELSRSYSREPAGFSGTDRYGKTAEGYTLFGSQLGEHLAYFQKLSARTEAQIDGLKRALDYVTSAAFLEQRNRELKQRQYETRRNDDALYARYRDITDAEIARMQLELKALDDLRNHLAVLLELGRMESNWINLKANDSTALSTLARVVNADSHAATADACTQIIKTYESDIAKLRRRAEDLDRLRKGLSRSGSLQTLDRQEELSGYYEKMKYRYERHIGWLSEQISGYRADLVELGKNK